MASTMASNEVRIIGGLWKGRKLRFPTSHGLRPTLGRVRETVFNWLIADVPGACCLDLFAGSGALGFEALSRGASDVTFVEQNRKAIGSLRDNAAALDARGATIVHMDAERYLKRASGCWDIVFFDPPFDDARADVLLATLLESASLAEGGLIYLERSIRQPFPRQPNLVKQGKAGDCHFGVLARP